MSSTLEMKVFSGRVVVQNTEILLLMMFSDICGKFICSLGKKIQRERELP